MNNMQINEIVSFIEDFSPNELILLQNKFPNNKKLFQSGQILGEDDENLLTIKLEACIFGLKVILKKCKELLPKVKRKIKKVSHLQLATQIIVGLSGAAIIFILDEKYNWLKYFTASMVLVGSILSIYIQHISNSMYNNNSLFNIYSSLNEKHLEAEQHLIELEIFSKSKLLNENIKTEIIQIIQNTNATCFQIRKIISHYQ